MRYLRLVCALTLLSLFRPRRRRVAVKFFPYPLILRTIGMQIREIKVNKFT